MTTTPNLTLYSIATELMQLILFRDSILEDPEMTPAEQRDSVEAIDRQIQEYVTAEVKKCDGIAHYLREFETRAEALKTEAKRCADLAKAWEKRRQSLNDMVISIMQATGQMRIDGRHSVLQLKKNPPSCEVAQPELVPEELQRITVKLKRSTWKLMLSFLDTPQLLEVAGVATESEPEPMKDEIKKRLKEGDGVPGCRLKTDSVRLEVK